MKRLFLGIISRQIFEYASVDLKYSIKYSGGRPSLGCVGLYSDVSKVEKVLFFKWHFDKRVKISAWLNF